MKIGYGANGGGFVVLGRVSVHPGFILRRFDRGPKREGPSQPAVMKRIRKKGAFRGSCGGRNSCGNSWPLRLFLANNLPRESGKGDMAM
ncbi:hypothetical protein RIF29_30098 [Crotalaria pallida]|uniref:Uncharacterized protein n=1 Tax=Crotalaria pallida TaxID=3830 RepID=A0AAN9HWS4_CROPI